MNDAVLIDSNILIYLVNLDDPRRIAAQRIVKKIFDGQIIGVVTPQIYQEFTAVISDNRRTHHYLTIKEIQRTINVFRRLFDLVIPTEISLKYWLKIIDDYNITRQKVFDAFLVASAYEHSIATIYTENVNDFKIYPKIAAINPLTE